jgi:hypothetical protein
MLRKRQAILLFPEHPEHPEHPSIPSSAGTVGADCRVGPEAFQAGSHGALQLFD